MGLSMFACICVLMSVPAYIFIEGDKQLLTFSSLAEALICKFHQCLFPVTCIIYLPRS